MSLCMVCGLDLAGPAEICGYHLGDSDDAPWAASNRALCDALHRGILLRRLDIGDREPVVLEVPS